MTSWHRLAPLDGPSLPRRYRAFDQSTQPTRRQLAGLIAARDARITALELDNYRLHEQAENVAAELTASKARERHAIRLLRRALAQINSPQHDTTTTGHAGRSTNDGV